MAYSKREFEKDENRGPKPKPLTEEVRAKANGEIHKILLKKAVRAAGIDKAKEAK